MQLRSLREIMRIVILCQKNLVIRRKSWRNQQPLKGNFPYQPHYPLTHRSCISGRGQKSEDFKIWTIFMNQLKINFHHQKMIHFLDIHSHAHRFVYLYRISILESNWDEDEIIDQIFIISHFKRYHTFYELISWQRSWSSKALGWIEDIENCCRDIKEK